MKTGPTCLISGGTCDPLATNGWAILRFISTDKYLPNLVKIEVKKSEKSRYSLPV